MYTNTADILKTLYKEKDGRVRDLKPADTESMWDMVCRGNAQAWQINSQTGEVLEGLPESYKYTEADELEDMILFPDEQSSERKDHLFKIDLNQIDAFEYDPYINVKRFANDLDSDEDTSEEESQEAVSDDGDKDWESDTSLTDDGDPEQKFDFSPKATPGDANKAMDILTEHFGTMAFSTTQKPDYFLSILRNPSTAWQLPSSIRNYPPDLMASCRLSLMAQKDYDMSPDGMHADFSRHLSREKARSKCIQLTSAIGAQTDTTLVFKRSWHQADLEPGARRRYIRWQLLVSEMDDAIMGRITRITPGPFELCKFMELAPRFFQERRIVKDAFEAYAAIALFFDRNEFFNFKDAPTELVEHLGIFDQAERAKHLPDRRDRRSNKTMPKEFWKQWDRLVKDHGYVPGETFDGLDEVYSLEDQLAIRPIVMTLFKAGIICKGYQDGAAGVVSTAKETNRGRDLYIDYRSALPHSRAVQDLEDPSAFDRDFLIAKARTFADRHPQARFSALRLWSSPHFYPLLLGIENREFTSFLDDRGRLWNWRFIPKDMPYSEWSVHRQLGLYLERYEHIFGDKVFVAKDLLLVMGKNEQELRRLSEGATFAVQTEPWRLEIDFWRSFVNVDVDFLEGLDRQWLD